jgi:hypothetical protein
VMLPTYSASKSIYGKHSLSMKIHIDYTEGALSNISTVLLPVCEGNIGQGIESLLYSIIDERECA